MTEQSTPTFRVVDLTELMEAGVLMAANERFFWPLGLALAWSVPEGAAGRLAAGEPAGEATDLHVRQWVYEDGHHEGIEVASDDQVATERRLAFGGWLASRVALMPDAEVPRALSAAYEVAHRVGVSQTKEL